MESKLCYGNLKASHPVSLIEDSTHCSRVLNHGNSTAIDIIPEFISTGLCRHIDDRRVISRCQSTGCWDNFMQTCSCTCFVQVKQITVGKILPASTSYKSRLNLGRSSDKFLSCLMSGNCYLSLLAAVFPSKFVHLLRGWGCGSVTSWTVGLLWIWEKNAFFWSHMGLRAQFNHKVAKLKSLTVNENWKDLWVPLFKVELWWYHSNQIALVSSCVGLALAFVVPECKLDSIWHHCQLSLHGSGDGWAGFNWSKRQVA